MAVAFSNRITQLTSSEIAYWSLSPHTGSLLAPVRYIDRARARGMTMTTSKEQEAFGLVVEAPQEQCVRERH